MKKDSFEVDAGYTSIPDEINECMKDDPSSVNTVGWVLRIEKWGKILLILITVIGIINSIGTGIVFARLDLASKESFSIIPCLVMIGLTLILDFIVYIIFQVIRIHLISQAEIVNNTKMAVKLLAYSVKKKE